MQPGPHRRSGVRSSGFFLFGGRVDSKLGKRLAQNFPNFGGGERIAHLWIRMFHAMSRSGVKHSGYILKQFKGESNTKNKAVLHF